MVNQWTISSFTGRGIQNGTGSVKAGRDINIKIPDPSNSEITDLLSQLHVSDPRLDKQRIEKTKGPLLKDCCDWILYHEAYISWHDSSEGQLLWLKGGPGKGKTMLVCRIIDQLRKQIQNNSTDGSLAYFFFEATGERINAAASALRSLTRTLLQNCQTVPEEIIRNYGKGGSDLFSDTNGWFALCDILTTILDETPLRKTFLLIDALDECVDGLEGFLELVAELPRRNVKVLVSSRNWPEIDAGLRPCPVKITIRLELNKQAISEAVSLYISAKVKDLAWRKDLDPETRDFTEKHLLKGADDTFLWVALVCAELNKLKIKKWNFRSTLTTFPPGLESLYDRMKDQVAKCDSHQLLRDVLAIVSLVYRPIELGELSSLVEDPARYPHDLMFWREIVESCGSFLTVQEDKVFFVHKSGQEYCTKLFGTPFFRSTIAETHGTIGRRAIRSLSDILHENIYNLESPGCPIYDVKIPEDDPLSRFKYSCVHWAEHLCEMTNDDGHDKGLSYTGAHGLVKSFIELHFLHWLESLSLLDAAHSAITSLINLVRVEEATAAAIEHRTESTLLGLLKDSIRFVRYFIACLRSYPIQLYQSAAVFTPSQTPVGSILHRKPPQWMAYLPKPRSHWAEYSRVLESASNAESLSVSPSGRKIASGHADGCVRLWDFITGQLLETYGAQKPPSLQYGGSITAVSFSITDDILAIATWRGDVSIINCRSAIPFLLREGSVAELESSAVSHLAFTPDGCCLMAAGATTGLSKWTLGTVSEQIAASSDWSSTRESNWYLGDPEDCLVALSPDSLLAAYVTHDNGALEIWNTLTRVCELRFAGPVDGDSTASFSLDSRKIAFEVRNTKHRQAEVRVRSVVGRADEVQASYQVNDLYEVLGWSPDGSLIALSSQSGLTVLTCSDGTVKRPRETLDATKACFSKDGETLISALVSESSIVLWEWSSVQGSDENFASAIPLLDVLLVAPEHQLMMVKHRNGNCMQLQSITGDKEWVRIHMNTFVPPEKLSVLIVRGGASPVIASSDHRGNVYIWRVTDSKCPVKVEAGDEVFRMEASCGDMIVGVVTVRGFVKLWATSGQAVDWEIPGELRGMDFVSMAFGPDGTIGLFTSDGSAAVVRDEKGFLLQQTRCSPSNPIPRTRAAGAFSPCGDQLAAGYRRGYGHPILKIWDIRSGQCQSVIEQPLPVVFQWAEREHKSASSNNNNNNNNWAVLRQNFSRLEIVPLSDSLQASLRHMDDKRDWLCLKEKPVLWLPPNWRPLDPVDPEWDSLGGWAGFTMPLYDRGGYYMEIRLSVTWLG